jgi:integrase
VFLTPKRSGGQPYADRQRRTGGQIKTAWKGAIARAGLDPEFTPHELRHTWASWHYALHKDLIRLQLDGGWSGVLLVTCYAHLMPQGLEDAIRRFLGIIMDIIAISVTIL